MTIVRFESVAAQRPRHGTDVGPRSDQDAWPAETAPFDDPDHRPLLRAALSSTVFAVVALVILRPRFESNDDVAMMWLADGTALGSPSPDLMFTNVLIGRVLTWLYTTWSAVSWYPLYLAALLWSSLTAQLYVLVAARPSGDRARLAYGTVLTANLLAWLNMQFTSTATLLGLAGVALICFGPSIRGRRSTELLLGGTGGVMVGLCSLVRFESLFLVAIVTAPVLVSFLRRLDWRRVAVFGLLALTIAGAGMLASTSARQSSEWASYQEWNSARGLLHDTPRLLDPAAEADLLAQVGWSVNDGVMFKEWLFLDRDIYDLESVDQIGASLDPDRDPVRIARRMASSALAAFPVILAAAIACLGCVVGGSRRQQFLCAATGVLSAAILSWLVLSAKIPMRVIVPMFTWFVLVAALTAPRGGTDQSRSQATLGVAAMVLAGATVLASAFLWGPASDREAADVERAMSTLERIDPDGVFVVWGGPIHHEYVHPFDRGTDPTIQFLFTGWMDRSPMQDELLERLELGDVMAAVAQRSDVHLVLTDELERPEDLFVTYLDEHGIEGSVLVETDTTAVRVLGCGDGCTR